MNLLMTPIVSRKPMDVKKAQFRIEHLTGTHRI